MRTVLSSIPMYDTFSSFCPAGTESEKLPSASVTVPTLVPATRTVAPITGSPSSCDTTFPVNCDWAKATPATSSWLARIVDSLLFI